MNDREKAFLKDMMDVGIALMNAARKTNVTQDQIHSIAFNPETGYVNCTMKAEGKLYDATRFDQFPEWDVTEYDHE